MSATIKITEPNGRISEINLVPGRIYSIGRAKDNDIVLNDRRVSRKHAQIGSDGNRFMIIDGYVENGNLTRSVNHVFVNGSPMLEKPLADGDVILIGESRIEYGETAAVSIPPVSLRSATNLPIKGTTHTVPAIAEVPKAIDYDDKPLGHTQFKLSANEIIGMQSHLSLESAIATRKRSRPRWINCIRHVSPRNQAALAERAASSKMPKKIQPATSLISLV